MSTLRGTRDDDFYADGTFTPQGRIRFHVMSEHRVVHRSTRFHELNVGTNDDGFMFSAGPEREDVLDEQVFCMNCEQVLAEKQDLEHGIDAI